MPSAAKPRVLYVTDLAYPARGRRYCDEDIALSARLRESFDLALCHPLDAVALMDAFDAVVVRNSGPVLHYRAAYEEFRERALHRGTRVFNQLTGRADMLGKQYLVDLWAAGLPVIPTVDHPADTGRLLRSSGPDGVDTSHTPDRSDGFVLKPKLGADSHGMEFVAADRLAALPTDRSMLAQPRIDFRYEVSFFFVDRAFQYALHAPEPEARWELVPYTPTEQDLRFAQRFVDWNTVDHGIQRVDACRTREGELLLVELEDLNPYLSLDALPADVRDTFVAAMTASVHTLLAAPD
ncbi:hypothetical protein QNO07_11270 [Streptomyces sp. 549]|uniref:hypothetical protein n=1 Tax=Streptomyces sp. 549 TaxID=3049076 RepID=UPI0024C44F4A|nr:hypothetical protein [Streptomyces sp. 549]MDK1473988.1 hypothetical protein [Streptomyces sp. 549]